MNKDLNLGVFGLLVNALNPSLFPKQDAEDLLAGAERIPGEVTEARRRGERVILIRNGKSPSGWFWQMPDGSKIT